MMITDLVAPEAILPALKVNGKKQALQELAGAGSRRAHRPERACGLRSAVAAGESSERPAVDYGGRQPQR